MTSDTSRLAHKTHHIKIKFVTNFSLKNKNEQKQEKRSNGHQNLISNTKIGTDDCSSGQK